MQVMTGDPQLMAQKNVIRAVSQRLSDDQISVREAALSLVGAYVAKSPDVAKSFEPALLLRLSDVGVSVRKRCVKILHDLLSAEPRFPGRSRAFCALLRRVADPREEDAVRDLIHDLFLKLWLEDGDAPFNGAMHPNNPTHQIRVEAIRGANSNKKPLTRSDLAAEQIVEVVRSEGKADGLEALLRDLLRGAADSDKGRKQAERNKRAELARTRCDRLVSSLFELLLSIEERRGPEGGGLHAKDIAATLQTISAFAESVPKPVLRRVEAVLPYLKADNGVPPADELAIVTASCEVLYRLASTCGHDTALAAARVAGDLRDVTYKYASTAVDAAIRTLSLLAEHASGRFDFEADLFKLSHCFYKYLHKKRDSDTSSDVRCLTVLYLWFGVRTVMSLTFAFPRPLLPPAEVSQTHSPGAVGTRMRVRVSRRQVRLRGVGR
jgi:cohesin loading factor subunit SCC2